MIKGWIVAGQTAQENLCPPESTTRPRLSELVQIDGSPHDWFEGRAGRCNLTVFIAVRRAHRADDATSRLYVQDVRADNCSCVICTSAIHGGRMPVLHRYMDVTY